MKNKKYGVGIDVGISSVGGAIVELSESNEPKRIVRLCGVMFDSAENPKDGASLALPRRNARSIRRVGRRKKHRKERIRKLLIDFNFVKNEDEIFSTRKKNEDIYELRTRALDNSVDNFELSRILINLAQRRGFKSNRKANVEDKETGKLLTAVSENERRMKENSYRSVGEMFYKDSIYACHRRNKGDEYISTVSRAAIEAEARLVLNTQHQLGNELVTSNFIDSYMDILLSQRPFDLGPGGDSPYGGNQIEKMIGKCTFEEEEQRAPKASYSFEYCSLLQKINHIRIIKGGESRALSSQERGLIVNKMHTTSELKYKSLRQLLALSDDESFNMVRYVGEDPESKEAIKQMKNYNEMRKALDKVKKGRIKSLSHQLLNEIARVFSVYKSDDKIVSALQCAGVEQVDIDALLGIKGFSKFGHLSVKACEKLIPFLENGMDYDKACTAAEYNFKSHDSVEKFKTLPGETEAMEAITSPVARRAISQTIKMINAIIREMGSQPTFINIETARELTKDFLERNTIKKENDENRARNERIVSRIRKDFNIANPTGMDIVKLKLYEEQGGVCLYSLRPIEASRLFEDGYVEVDHIVPYSISFDDRYINKVLVFTEENRQKGDRLPLQYLKGEKAERFTVYVNNNVRNFRKKQILLKADITDDDRSKFKERNLQDTKTISRFLYNYINDNLLFEDWDNGRIKHVIPVNGAITAYLRKRWGIQKIRANGDTHHAVDALIVACTTDGLIQRVSNYSRYKELEFVNDENGGHNVDLATGELIDKFPFPWKGFRNELEARLSSDPQSRIRQIGLENYSEEEICEVKPIFIARKPKHKVTGAVHKATLKSGRHIDEGIVLVKTDIKKLKLNKDGEIENYYMPNSDVLLYEALKARLAEFGGKGEKAFEENFYKPKSDGSRGPIVKKVKLVEKSTLNVSINGGTAYASNESMVRIDVFYVDNEGYYFVPIYVSDTVKEKLPNKACVANKHYELWKEMKEEDFIFSIYPNDLLLVEPKKELKLSKSKSEADGDNFIFKQREFVYFVSADISNAAIVATNHDRSYVISKLGVKTLKLMEKWQVNPLGDITKIHKEKRMTFK